MYNSNYLKRFLSSIVIGGIFITTIFVLRPFFDALIYLIATMMLLEWFEMTKSSKFYSFLGLLIITIPTTSLLIISFIDKDGWILFSLFSCIWCMDVTAMIGGKTFKGPKLAPQISPNKTISGLISGIFSVALLAYIYSKLPNYIMPGNFNDLTIFITYAMILGVIAQMSDLFISIFKRKFNIKDSGKIIPGHGGFLDRFDSIIFTAPAILIYLYLANII